VLLYKISRRGRVGPVRPGVGDTSGTVGYPAGPLAVSSCTVQLPLTILESLPEVLISLLSYKKMPLLLRIAISSLLNARFSCLKWYSLYYTKSS
jgi:hypothetical protein